MEGSNWTGEKNNWGSPIRQRYTMKEKGLLIEMIESHIDNGRGKNVREVLRWMKFSAEQVNHHASNYNKCLKAGVMDEFLEEVGKKKKKFPTSNPHFMKWRQGFTLSLLK